jgi:Prokaryotic lipoprotein-attachment site
MPVTNTTKASESQADRNTDQSLRLRAFMLALAASVLLTGCGRSGPQRVATHQAKGRVTYAGHPAAGAFVVLHAKNQPEPGAPTPTATVQPDGTFALTTYDAGDGVPEGDYVVTLQWRKTVKSGSDYLLGPNLLPAKYGRPETSDIVVHVAAGQAEIPPIALKR